MTIETIIEYTMMGVALAEIRTPLMRDRRNLAGRIYRKSCRMGRKSFIKGEHPATHGADRRINSVATIRKVASGMNSVRKRLSVLKNLSTGSVFHGKDR
jgi:hypothetical protein